MAIYVGGALVSAFGVALVGIGTGGPFGGGNPGVLVVGALVVLAGYVIALAGTLGIGYKVIADGVRSGVDNSRLGDGSGG